MSQQLAANLGNLSVDGSQVPSSLPSAALSSSTSTLDAALALAAPPAADQNSVLVGAAAGEPVVTSQDEKPVPLLASQTSALVTDRALLTALVQLDMSVIERSADAFLGQLQRLGEEWGSPNITAKLTLWLALVSVAAYEIAAATKRQSAAQSPWGTERLPGWRLEPPEDEK